jgi:hypothetical protein
VVVLVVAAVLGLIGIHRDAVNGAAAEPVTDSPRSSTASGGAASATPPTHQAFGADQRGDTTGPDLLNISVAASRGMLRVRMALAAPVTDDVVLHVFIDADSDRTTGSLSFPCSAATLGADYEITTHGARVDPLLRSTADGCATPFTPETSARLTMRVADDRASIGIPTRAVRRPGEHLIGLFAQALSSHGGQIDSCPGQHDRPLSVQY